jgi:hypothetical protein
MMHEIEVRAAEGATLIFTVTERATEPWAFNNTTILVTAEQLEPLIQKLQTRLAEVQALRQATPQFPVGHVVVITGNYRQGQHGRVVEVREKEPRLQRLFGERWAYTVGFADGMTWTYRAEELDAPRP